MHSSLQRLEDLEGRKDHADQEAAIRLRGVHGEYGTVAHEQASVASGTTMSGMPESGTLMSGMDTMEIQEQSTMDDTVGGSAGVDCGTHPDDPVAGSADPGCGSDLPQSAPRQSSIGEQVGSMDEGDNVDDEDLWEDVEEDDEESGAAEEITENARGSRPSEDDIGNNFVRIVHLNGVHYLPLLHCLCGGEERLHVDLSQARLIPTSFTRIKTLFTCAVLDDYRLSNLEMKASAYQYWQKIVRITSPDGVTQVPDLYRELRRLSREWRWLKKIKWAGFGHENRDPMNPAPGELSIFSAANPPPAAAIPPPASADSSTPAHTEEPTSQQGHPITPSAPVAATTGETSPSSGSAPEPQPEAAAAPPAPAANVQPPAPPADVEAPAPPANVEPPPAPAIVEPPPAPTIEPLPAPASVEPPPVQPAVAKSAPAAPPHIQAPNAVASSSRVTIDALMARENGATLAVPAPPSRRSRSPSPAVPNIGGSRYPLRSMAPESVKTDGGKTGSGGTKHADTGSA
ncbi:hypothetical protein LshimejAT787_0402550 [Lyophyllum shimeji]|uniref:CxC2-like cysteine cluster KDZ transposase-associated domain-containing protein n=1 Tax=Lyophyllum shimeji TaxID=47721 RepID=A0A9P3PKM6_LYOSH|nr:hypothetical protein LshimejAT787_0402550 [Lyophyllum shimeji]